MELNCEMVSGQVSGRMPRRTRMGWRRGSITPGLSGRKMRPEWSTKSKYSSGLMLRMLRLCGVGPMGQSQASGAGEVEGEESWSHQARIRSCMLVKSLSSGDGAMRARTGLRSTYAMAVMMDAWSRRTVHLKRDSQNRPLTWSSLFAARAMGSLRHRMNQLREERRRRRVAIRLGDERMSRMRGLEV